MNETVCNFGPDGRLFGILTQPETGMAVEGAPIAIILNSGIVHRIGPFRMNVDIARKLAAKGFSTLRINLSGLGDSDPRTGKFETDQRAQLDVADAMDFLMAEKGTREFVLMGLCSGAYHAHRIAVADDRIVGVASMDGIVFRTVGFYWRHHFLRYLRPRFWRNAIKRRMLEMFDQPSERSGESLAEREFFNNDELTVQGVRNDLVTMLGRGVQMLFVYTAGYDDISSRSQFREMYKLDPDEDGLQVVYYPRAEHTFRLVENRRVATDRIANWFQHRFSKPLVSCD